MTGTVAGSHDESGHHIGFLTETEGLRLLELLAVPPGSADARFQVGAFKHTGLAPTPTP